MDLDLTNVIYDDWYQLDESKHGQTTKNYNGPNTVGGGSVYCFTDGSARFLKVHQSFNPQDLWSITAARTNLALP